VIAKSFGLKTASASLFALIMFSALVLAQKPNPTPKTIMPDDRKPMPVAVGSNLYCAGYIQTSSVNTNLEIVGNIDEPEKHQFTLGTFVYINAGASQGMKVGDGFSVVRPRGKFSSKFSKKGNLGIYVQEVGAVEIIKIGADYSVALVKTSCDAMLLGDLLQPFEKRTSTLTRKSPPLNLFSEANGKSLGRIVMARNGQEMVSRDQIVYIDLGDEDNLKAGDYLTVFRPLGKGGITGKEQSEINQSKDDYFESGVYQGGKFSSQSARKSGENADGKKVSGNDAKSRRPNDLRRVVGEIVILNVKEKTATAVITRTATEIHTGDMVELQ
jgi:hypothetical protein